MGPGTEQRHGDILLRVFDVLRKMSIITMLNVVRWALSWRGVLYLGGVMFLWAHGFVRWVKVCTATGLTKMDMHTPVTSVGLLSPVMYSCALESLVGADGNPACTKDEMRVCPSFILTGVGLPLDPRVRQRLRCASMDNVCANDFTLHAMAWVEYGSRIFLGYTVPPDWAAELAVLRAGDVAPPIADASLRHALVAAGILNNGAAVAAEMNCRAAEIEAARRHFKQRGFAVLGDLLPPSHLAALRTHCREVAACCHQYEAGYLDNQSYLSTWSEPAAAVLNEQLTQLASQVVGIDLVASRPLVLWYRGDSMLKLHVDERPYCFSMSLCIDSDHNAAPLTLISRECRSAVIDVNLTFGQAVLFHGEAMPHYRDLKRKQHCISMSFSWDRT